MASSKTLIAIDTGGTFTDFFVISGTTIRTHKVLSTPHDPSRAIIQGLNELGMASDAIIHGSTVSTNALLEHKGARVALVTTAGFEDVIEIGRQNRDSLYDINVTKQPALVARPYRFSVQERVDHRGRVLQGLSQAEQNRLIRCLRKKRIDSIAICTLNSYANASHETALANSLKKLSLPLSVSSEICPEYREYERASTTCVNAYVTPIMSRYLSRLSMSLSTPIRVMQSNGGSLSINEASREAVRTLLSGPAGGALGALKAAKQAGYDRLMALDMGGTSTDLTLIDKEIELTSEASVGPYPIKSPMIRIHTIGAGGGSLASIDVGGALKVGPESAGAAPGPICYGRGGKQVTITDAQLWLGRLSADHFLGGTMKLQSNKVAAPLKKLARQLKLSPDETADGIIQVANAHMVRALRVISLERGYDPRQFTLVAFGGAGGLHACELAARLEIPRVLIPNHPGILSAYGMAHADWARDYVQTVLLDEAAATATRLKKELARLKRKALADAKREGHPIRGLKFKMELDLRYCGQSYELRVPFSARFKSAFVKEHQQYYGYSHDEALEIVNVRLQVRAAAHKTRLPNGSKKVRAHSKAPVLKRSKLHWQGKRLNLALYERDKLVPGHRFAGPALIVEFSGTTFVPPGWQVVCDRFRNLVITS